MPMLMRERLPWQKAFYIYVEISEALDKDVKEAAEAIHKAVENKNYTNQDNYTAVIMAC